MSRHLTGWLADLSYHQLAADAGTRLADEGRQESQLAERNVSMRSSERQSRRAAQERGGVIPVRTELADQERMSG
jgi:hypothetical protein